MTQMISTTVMIQRLEGMLGTNDLNEWERGFVRSLSVKLEVGLVTQLSEKQVERLIELHDKHFA